MHQVFASVGHSDFAGLDMTDLDSKQAHDCVTSPPSRGGLSSSQDIMGNKQDSSKEQTVVSVLMEEVCARA